MDSKIRDKIKRMILSEDQEIRMLGERMFWDNDPYWSDFCKLTKHNETLEPRVFYHLKAKGRVYIKGSRMYIYRWDRITDEQLRGALSHGMSIKD